MAKLPLIIRILGKLVLGRKNPPLPALPQKGRWYRVNMPGRVASDGSEYGFDMRLGSENRLIVYGSRTARYRDLPFDRLRYQSERSDHRTVASRRFCRSAELSEGTD